MAIETGYFNSIDGDRKYNAEQMSKYFAGIFTKGVLQNYGDAFVVKAGIGMTVNVQSGKAFFSDGKFIENTATEVLTLEQADTILNRIDRVVLSKDTSNGVRTAKLIIKKGELASKPTPPVLINDLQHEELCIANVFVKSKTSVILQSDITDTRFDGNVCGIVTGAIEQLDLSEAFSQYQAQALNSLLTNQKTFDDWFVSVKDEVATKTLIRSYENSYTTKENDETRIPIGISQFNKEIDILQVFINGMKLIPEQDFTCQNIGFIDLTKPLCKNTPVNFTVYKSIDGSEAETVVTLVHELENEVNKLKTETADSGWHSLTLGSGVKEHSAVQYPVRCRKIGKQVQVEGLITNTVALNVTVATIPDGFRPSKNQIVTVPISKKTTGRSATLIFFATGEIKIDAINSSEPLQAGDYISLKTNYFVD